MIKAVVQAVQSFETEAEARRWLRGVESEVLFADEYHLTLVADDGTVKEAL